MADSNLIEKQAAHSSLISLNPRGDDQIHLIDFLRSLSETAATADDLLLGLREVCLPSVIAKKTITNNPNMFIALRKLLMAFGIEVRRSTGFPIIHGVLEVIFQHDQALLQEALQIWKAREQDLTQQIDGSRNAQQIPTSEIQTRQNFTSRNAQDVSKRFPHAQKFSGKMGDSPSFSEIRNQFMDVIEELDVPHAQQVVLLRSALREESYQFYQDIIKDKVTSLADAFRLLEETYASTARQEQTKTMLQSLSSKFQEHSNNPLVALNEIYSDISRLASQCSPKYRDDSSKADFLKTAVEKQPWACGAVEEYLSNPTGFMPNKFQGFHGRLTAALTARAAAGDPDSRVPASMNQFDSVQVYPTHFGSKYGVRTPPRFQKTFRSPQRNPKPALNASANISPRLSDADWSKLTPEEKKMRRTCYKCGQKGHYSGDAICTRSDNSMTDSIKARYRESGSDSAAASMILFEIAISIDEEEREARTDSGEVNINYFDHLIEEYHESAENSTQSLSEEPNFGVPSIE
jgi:hypothetical protein